VQISLICVIRVPLNSTQMTQIKRIIAEVFVLILVFLPTDH